MRIAGETALLSPHASRACAVGHQPAAKFRSPWGQDTHNLYWTMHTKALIPAGSTATKSVVHGPSCLHTILSASYLYKRQRKMYKNYIAIFGLVLHDAQPYWCFIYHQTEHTWRAISAISCTRQQRDSVCKTRKARVAHLTLTAVWTTPTQLSRTRLATCRLFAAALLSLVLRLLAGQGSSTSWQVNTKPGSSNFMSQESV